MDRHSRFTLVLLLGLGVASCESTRIRLEAGRLGFDGKVHIRIYRSQQGVIKFQADLGGGKIRLIGMERRDELRDRESFEKRFGPRMADLIPEMTDRLASNLNQGNLSGIQKIVEHVFREQTPYGLVKESMDLESTRDDAVLKNFAAQYFLPNSRVTYAVHREMRLDVPNHHLVDLNDLSVHSILNMLGDDNLYDYMEFHKYSWSPDGNRLAFAAQAPLAQRHTLVVADAVKRQVIMKKELTERIESLAWSPDSRAVAVLTGSSRLGVGPIESYLAACGHGVPYVTFTLRLLSVPSGETLALPVIDDVKYGTGIVAWAH
jgi:hypothetical protein